MGVGMRVCTTPCAPSGQCAHMAVSIFCLRCIGHVHCCTRGESVPCPPPQPKQPGHCPCRAPAVPAICTRRVPCNVLSSVVRPGPGGASAQVTGPLPAVTPHGGTAQEPHHAALLQGGWRWAGTRPAAFVLCICLARTAPRRVDGCVGACALLLGGAQSAGLVGRWACAGCLACLLSPGPKLGCQGSWAFTGVGWVVRRAVPVLRWQAS